MIRWHKRSSVPGWLGLATVVALAACGGTHSSLATSALSSTPISGDTYALQVLGEAPIPTGARATDVVHSDFLKEPFQSIRANGLIDIHRIYVIDQQPGAVESYITSHLPKGATLAGTGTLGSPTGVANGIEISMPTSGPNENYAELIYEVVSAANQSAEFRVDAQVIWVNDRSADELAPSDAAVEVTGFSQTSLANLSSGPVTINLTQAQADSIRAAANSLPLSPQPVCMEDSLLYRVNFRPSAFPNQTFELDGYECAATVLVSSNGKALSPLNDAGCHLLAEVVSLFPKGQADGTRGASSALCH